MSINLNNDKIKILICDDNRTFRRILGMTIKKYPEFDIIGEAGNGTEASELIEKLSPDVVLLDIEMPEKNGIDVLKDLKKISLKSPCQIIVISASNNNEHNADITLTCLAEGAFDFIKKPVSSSFQDNISELENLLITRIRLAHSKNLLKTKIITGHIEFPAKKAERIFNKPINLIAIGISTGGPIALETIVKNLPEDFPAPVVIIQHMPANFTLSLAKRLNKLTALQAQELKENMPLKKGNIYIAPGAKHTILRKSPLNNQFFFSYKDIPPVNHCKPSVDVFFNSLANHYNNDMIFIIMTGMGNDGLEGLKNLKEKDAYIIAQDEATSAVWGMPGSAVEAGIVNEVLPLDKISSRLVQLCN
ncbi:MAG TPA: chemotaxis response regulator protein-glutamate methylesterase [bacterium]|nr:chemotaxis response regulator protein-glutamate methylesterase [bacterium]